MNNDHDPLDVLRTGDFRSTRIPHSPPDCGRASKRPRDCSNSNQIERKE